MTADGAGRFDWERLLMRCKLPSTVKHVGLALATYANADGTNCRPGVAYLIEDTGLSERAVRRSLTTLRGVGLIDRTSSGHSSGRLNFVDVYRLRIPGDLMEHVELHSARRGQVPATRTGTRRRSVPAPVAGTASAVPATDDQVPATQTASTGHGGPLPDHFTRPLHQDARAKFDECSQHRGQRPPPYCGPCRSEAIGAA